MNPPDRITFNTAVVAAQRDDAGRITGYFFTEFWQRWFSALYNLLFFIQVKATLDFPNTPAQTSSDLTVAIRGARPLDFVELSTPVPPNDTCYFAFVGANDVVTIRFCNFSAGAVDPAEADFNLRLRKQ